MSDISALSHDYEATSQFADRINSAVLQLKKSLHQSQARPDLGELASVVEAVKTQLSSSEHSTTVPTEVVERLSSEHQAQMSYLIADLQSAEEALRGKAAVDPAVIRVLDEICDAADASASAMFRRLRRR
jgi:hypothetical protein